jgi:hypothetical protein
VPTHGLHLLVTDFGLRDHHRQLYDRLERWLLSSSVVLGGSVGIVSRCPPLLMSVLVAFSAAASSSMCSGGTSRSAPEPLQCVCVWRCWVCCPSDCVLAIQTRSRVQGIPLHQAVFQSVIWSVSNTLDIGDAIATRYVDRGQQSRGAG